MEVTFHSVHSAFAALLVIIALAVESVDGSIVRGIITNCSCTGCVPYTTAIVIDCRRHPYVDSDLLSEEIDSLLSSNVTFGHVTSLSIVNSTLTDVPRSVCRLTTLTQLHLYNNRLSRLPDNCFSCLTALTLLNAWGNGITELQDGLFDGLNRLQTLLLSHNRISSIGLRVFNSSAMLTSLREVQLRANRLTTLEPWPYWVGVNGYPDKAIVDLRSNKIRAFTNVMGLSFRCGMKKMDLELGIGDNKIKHMSDLFNGWNLNITTLLCLGPIREGSPGFKVDISTNYLDCDCLDFKIHALLLFATRSHILTETLCAKPDSLYRERLASVPLDQLVCDVTERCPSSCHCVHRPANATLHVDCSHANLKALPLDLPELPKSYTRYKLDFSNNRLLRRLEHRDYFVNTSILDVSNCGIETVENWGDVFHSKNVVYLHGNRLMSLPHSVAVLNVSTGNVSLYDNPWRCSCDDKWTAKWLNSVSQRLLNSGYILCGSPSRLHGMSVLQISEEAFCVDPVRRALAIGMSSVVAVVLVLLTVGIVIYRLRVKLYTRWKFHPFDRDECLGEDMDYDVFIASSSIDNLPHGDGIRVRLEEHGYRVCYPPRDFLAGRPIIDNIYEAIVRSKRTVCLLTTNFIERLDPLYVPMLRIYYEPFFKRCTLGYVVVVLMKNRRCLNDSTIHYVAYE